MTNLFSVKESVVLISGSSRGIGLELARGFLEQEAKVSILSENAEELSDALEELQKTYSDRVYGVFCDVRSFACLLYTSPSPRDGLLSRMPSSA